jgi:predicted nucleotide-binding protein (sugar kinase/HSP70/actin superfamily)
MRRRAGGVGEVIQTGEPGVVLVGRPYNIHDAGVSLSTARKLRELYGVNVLPVDALPVQGIDIERRRGQHVLVVRAEDPGGAKLVAQHENLHEIHIDEFQVRAGLVHQGVYAAGVGQAVFDAAV